MRTESVEVLRPDSRCTVFYVESQISFKEANEIADYLQERTQSNVAVVSSQRPIAVTLAVGR
jgi:hypothetical protein